MYCSLPTLSESTKDIHTAHGGALSNARRGRSGEVCSKVGCRSASRLHEMDALSPLVLRIIPLNFDSAFAAPRRREYAARAARFSECPWYPRRQKWVR